MEHSSEEKRSGGKWRERGKEGGWQEMHYLILKKRINKIYFCNQIQSITQHNLVKKSRILQRKVRISHEKKQKEHARIAWIKFEYIKPRKAN